MGVHQQQPAALGGACMAKTAIGLQDLYLNQIRKEHIPVIIYLINGVHGDLFGPSTILLYCWKATEEMT